MPRKIVFWLLTTVLLSVAFPAMAQQPARIFRVGFLSGSGETSAVEGTRQGLRSLGYIEGKNIVIEFRSAEGKLERAPDLVAELLRLKVDVLVSTSLTLIRAAKQATKTIPIVMLSNADPVAAGLVDSLAHPGGNITGLSTLDRELSGKRLELLKEAVPGISRVGVLWVNSPGPLISFKEYEAAARALKLSLQSLEVRGPTPDLEGALQAAAKGRVSALVTIGNSLINRYLKQIPELAIKNRLPSMYQGSDWVEAGGLMSYSANDAANARRAAYYVDRILKGAKPSDLPVEQPTKFEFVINLKTAKQIGVTVPQSVLFRADRVIK